MHIYSIDEGGNASHLDIWFVFLLNAGDVQSRLCEVVPSCMEGGSVGRTTSELPFHRRKRRRVARDMKICRPRWGEKKGDEDFFPFPPLRDILLLFFKGIRSPPLSPSGDLTREEVFGLGDNWLPRQTEFDFQGSKSFFPSFLRS